MCCKDYSVSIGSEWRNADDLLVIQANCTAHVQIGATCRLPIGPNYR